MVAMEQRVVAFVVSALAAAIVVPPAADLHAVAACLALMLALSAQFPLARGVPPGLAGARRRHRLLSLLWLLLATVAVVQTARLSAFMTDVSRTWGSTTPDAMVVNHQCLAAYVEAADLARRGESNLYDARWYPAYRGACGLLSGWTRVDDLGRWLSDPYEYPPHFLVVPRAALALTNSFLTIRTTWFVLQAFALLGAALALARWLGGRSGDDDCGLRRAALAVDARYEARRRHRAAVDEAGLRSGAFQPWERPRLIGPLTLPCRLGPPARPVPPEGAPTSQRK